MGNGVDADGPDVGHRGASLFLRSLELFTNEAEVQLNVLETNRPVARRFFDWCAERIPGWAQGPLDYPAAGAIYRVGARSFFQVNRFLIDRLVETALEDAAGETALDLYAGVGLFSLPLARQFGSVTAVEAGSDSDLRFNAERAGLSLRVEQSTAERFLANLKSAPDFVLLDPPRAGLGKEVVGHLTRLHPRHITIVACDPATLARDLAGLTAGGYSIDRLTLVDLFPQTFHMEAVVRILGQASYILPRRSAEDCSMAQPFTLFEPVWNSSHEVARRSRRSKMGGLLRIAGDNRVRCYSDLNCVKLILPWSTASIGFCASELKVVGL
jgi:hypothetical protein